MGRMNEPPRLPEGSFAAWSRDRLAMARRGADECGDVWQLEPGVYVAATAGPCEAVLRGAQDFPKATGPLFPPLKRSSGAPTPEDRARAHAARMRGLRPQAVAARIGEIAPSAARFADQWPTGRDVEILPPVRHALAEIGVRYLFSEDAPTLLPFASQLFLAREVLVRPSRWVWPRWVPTPARRFRTRQQVAFTNALRPIVRRRRSSGRLGDDMLGQMLRPSPATACCRKRPSSTPSPESPSPPSRHLPGQPDGSCCIWPDTPRQRDASRPKPPCCPRTRPRRPAPTSTACNTPRLWCARCCDCTPELAADPARHATDSARRLHHRRGGHRSRLPLHRSPRRPGTLRSGPVPARALAR